MVGERWGIDYDTFDEKRSMIVQNCKFISNGNGHAIVWGYNPVYKVDTYELMSDYNLVVKDCDFGDCLCCVRVLVVDDGIELDQAVPQLNIKFVNNRFLQDCIALRHRDKTKMLNWEPPSPPTNLEHTDNYY